MMSRSVTLNGREYPLRFTVNGLCCLEEKTGQSLDDLHSRSFSCLRGLLWCALLTAHPDITLAQAGDLLEGHLQSGGSLDTVSSALAGALSDACFFRTGERARTGSPSP